MQKPGLLILLLSLFINSYGQTVDTTIQIGHHATYDKLPKLVFVDINSSEFLNYKKHHQSELDTSYSKVISSDTSVIIQTSKTKLFFPKPPSSLSDTKRYYVNYKGFNNQLKIYIFESYYVGEFTLGGSFFIDSISNIKYELVEHSDFPFEPPVFSPDNRFMITYIYDVFSPEECFLGVIKIRAAKKSFTFEEFASGTTGLIEELVWINNSSFAIKVKHKTRNEKNGDWDESITYLKTILPKSKND